MRELVTVMVCPDLHPCTFAGAAKIIPTGTLSRGCCTGAKWRALKDGLIYVQFMDDFLRRVGTALY
jgi:hypothetical protein